MDADGEYGAVAPSEGCIVPLLALGFLGFGVRPAFAFKEDVGNRGEDSHLGRCLAGGGGEPVLVVEDGGACAYHLKACDLGSPVYEVLVKARLYVPDALYPVLEKHVFANAAHKGHCGVGMAVDETGNGG